MQSEYEAHMKFVRRNMYNTSLFLQAGVFSWFI